MTVAFNTQYDGEGATQFQTGMKEVGAQIDQIGEKSAAAGINLEGLTRRLERPLSALVFSGVADSLVGLGDKGMSATQQVEKGLHAVGLAISFINPLWGALFLAAAEVFNLYEKFTHVKTAEEIDKESKSIMDQISNMKEFSEVLKKGHDIRKDDLLLITDSIEAKKRQLEVDLQTVNIQIEKNKQAELDLINNRESQRSNFLALDLQTRINEKHEKEIDLLKQRQILESALNTITKGPDQDNTAIFQKKHDMKIQARVDNEDLARVTHELDVSQKFLDDTEEKILHTTDPKKLKMYEDQYDKIVKLETIQKQHQSTLETAAAQETSTLGNLGDAVKAHVTEISTVWAAGAKSLMDTTKAMAAAIVNDFANMEAGTLEMDATKNLFINPGLAIAEIAGAAAIRATGSALAGTFGGSSSSAPSSSPSAYTPGNTASPNAGVQGNQSQLTVNINGGMIDKPTVSYIMQLANQLVQQNGFPLVATHINGISPMPGSA